MPSKVQPSGLHAVLAVDPGGTTGVAAAYIRLEPTLKATLQKVMRRKSVEVKGEWMEQARELSTLINRFRYTANVDVHLPLENIHVVFEDFVLRMPATTTNLTSIWVAAATCARLDGFQDVEWQQPSQAKHLGSDERLRLWGLWEVGSAHKRDAWRHFALKVNKLVG